MLIQHSSLSRNLSGLSASRSSFQPLHLPRHLGGLAFPSTQGTRLGLPKTLKVPLHVHPRSRRTAERLEPMSFAAVTDKEQLCLAEGWGVGTPVGRGTPTLGRASTREWEDHPRAQHPRGDGGKVRGERGQSCNSPSPARSCCQWPPRWLRRRWKRAERPRVSTETLPSRGVHAP